MMTSDKNSDSLEKALGIMNKNQMLTVNLTLMEIRIQVLIQTQLLDIIITHLFFCPT